MLLIKLKLLFKTCIHVCLIGLVGMLVVYQVMAAPTRDDCILRVEVYSNNGEMVKVSMPVSLLNAIDDLLPKEIRNLCNDLEIDIDKLVDGLNDASGYDLVKIEGHEHVRIWADPATSYSKRKDLGFLEIEVHEGGWNGQHIHFSIPQGLIKMVSKIIKTSGVVDHFIEVPPEVTNLEFLKIDL